MVCAKNPPSTTISVPVTKLLALRLARKTAAPVNSSAAPNRFIGVWPQIASVRAVGEPSSLKSSLRFCSAGKNPGVMVFTRTPCIAHSRARNFVRLKTAALAAEYVTTRDKGRCAETLAMLMMLPWPRSHMAGPNSWQGNTTPPTRFKLKFARQSSAPIASKGWSAVTVTFASLPPAAFNRMVGAPNAVAICR